VLSVSVLDLREDEVPDKLIASLLGEAVKVVELRWEWS
jgi:hypothetical protein